MAKDYTDETRAAVMSALMTGQSVSSIAKEYSIPKGTVSAWKTRQTVARVADVATQKANDEELADLLLKYLRTNLKALVVQAEMFGDRKWLEKHPASEISLLHGIQTDKAIRILEAFSQDDDDTTPQD